MDLDEQFQSIIESLINQKGQEIEQIQEAFCEMINQYPEELVAAHFKILFSTENDSVRHLTLILLGRYFDLIKVFKIELSDEISEFIQNSLFSLFQNQNFTKQNFDYLSYDIFKCARYFQQNWTQLPELLYELIISDSTSSTALNCLSDCISNQIFDTESYSDLYYNYAKETLLSSPESNLSKLSSLLRLIYSLANSKDYQNKEIFIPLFDEIPNYLEYSINCEDCCRIINDFLINVTFSSEIFENSYREYFNTLTKMISDPSYEKMRNTSIIILSKLISAFKVNFKDESISLFDFYIENFNTETHELFENSFYELSNLYGYDREFANHIFEYLQNNAPSPSAYISIASSFNGIKSHFIELNLKKELFELFSIGFESEDEFVRHKAFLCFKYIIRDIRMNENDEDSTFSVIEILNQLNFSIQKESDNSILFNQIQTLSILFERFSNQFVTLIEEIVKTLDALIESADQISSQIELFQCYKHISISFGSEFLPYSESFITKMIQITSLPNECEDIFYSIIEFIPLLKYSIPEEDLNELISNVFGFLFSEVYDEDGNQISDVNQYQNNIINFFVNSLQNDTICNSIEFIEKVIKIAFENSSLNNCIDKVEKESDLSIYYGYRLLKDQDPNFFNLISITEVTKVLNSLKILNIIFESNEDLIDDFEDNRIELMANLFDHYFIFENDSADILILPLLKTKDEFLQVLNHAVQLLMKIIKNQHKLSDFDSIICFLFECAKIVGLKFKETFEKVDDIIDSVYRILIEILNLSYLEYVSNKFSINNELLEEIQIKISLVFRELFKHFPSSASSYLASFSSEVLFLRPFAIISSDFARFCLDDNSEKNVIINNFLKAQNESDVPFISYYVLSIVSDPLCIDIDSISNLLDAFLKKLNAANNDDRHFAIFILLQIFRNYSSLLDFSDCFWNLFDADAYLLPNYCIEYFAQSMIFFVTNFEDSIPVEKEDDVLNVISNLVGKKLDRQIIENLNDLMRFF